MMGQTHIFMGIASALAVTSPENFQQCLPAIVGGALGGSLSDIDVNSNKSSKNTLYAKLIASGILPIALIIDYIAKGSMIAYITGCSTAKLVMGIVLFIALCLIGSKQSHRGFTHSFLALALFSISVGLFCTPILFPFIIGFISHILLDTLNKRSVKLFFPIKKGISFDLCYSNKTVDKLLLVIGIIVTALFLGYSIYASISIHSPSSV